MVAPRRTAGRGPLKSTPAKSAPARPATKTAAKKTAAKKATASARAKSAEAPLAAPAGAGTDPAVVAFLHDLEHPKKAAIEAIRRVILDAAPQVREGIKWNAPSFCTREWFATFNLRPQDRVRVIFHLGARVKDTPGFAIADPAGLLEWLGKDRALVTLRDVDDVANKRAGLQALVRAWIEWL